MRHALLLTCLMCTALAGPLSPRAAGAVPATIAPVALVNNVDWNWDWDGFKKFWRRQLGKTTGVAGVATLVVIIGALIVMSARKKI